MITLGVEEFNPLKKEEWTPFSFAANILSAVPLFNLLMILSIIREVVQVGKKGNESRAEVHFFGQAFGLFGIGQPDLYV